MNSFKLYIVFTLYFLNIVNYSLLSDMNEDLDSAKKARSVLQDAKVKSDLKFLEMTIRNVDITKFPEISVIVEAFNLYGEQIDSLHPSDLTIMENGVEKKVISVQKISVKERVPVDFIFIIDKTGSMQKHIDAVRYNLNSFTTSIIRRGIDFRLGLILFSDEVEKLYQPTDNLTTFLSWLGSVKAAAGGDEKENALEAIKEACSMDFRPSANKVGILVTDAPYHQKFEKGAGVTNETTESILNLLLQKDLRLFSIVPPKLKNYQVISEKTRGKMFDIEYPFATILDNFSNQLTNLFKLTYRTEQPAIPDSINIALLNENKMELVRKTIPIIELGRKLIIENLLYETNSALLPKTVPELEVLTEFMQNKQNVTITVEGHTDSRGSHKLNDALSQQRAESVKRYLVAKGINPNRIFTIGYGKRKPIGDNDTEFGRTLNRRTEIVITSK